MAAFLSQLFYYPWLGALVIAAQAWLLGHCLAYLLKTMGFKYGQLARYIPAPAAGGALRRYAYFVPTTMALLAALLFASGYVAIAKRRSLGVSLVVFAMLSAACYYSAGGTYLLFALVCIIYEVMTSSVASWASPTR